MMDPCAGDVTCLAASAEFVRLRYFFGQRLGVIDLADEQSYVVGKQRFHNLRAHGCGVLCGLDAERYVFPQGASATTPTTLLRVRRGAALDCCGREIVVGWDQCIDVAAWFAQHPHVRPSEGATSLRLWVAVCYRECPSDPAPAPRDPCGCGNEGCAFARIREGFELKLLTDDEEQLLAKGMPAPLGVGVIAEEVLSGSIDDAFTRLVAQSAGASCPDPPADPCLLLASFQATLDSAGSNVIDLRPPDNTIPARLSLLSTSVLQQEVLRALAAANDAGLVGAGPRFGAVTFIDGGDESQTLSVQIQTAGADLSRDPTVQPEQLTVSLSQFHDDGSWSDLPSPRAQYVGAPAVPAHLDLTWTNGLNEGGRYRVLIESNSAHPPVDTRMRPLAPLSWARHFRLVNGAAGKLVLADSLF
jgi:hypothetical protein